MVFETKILLLEKQKKNLLCAYWPLSAAMLSSKAANQEEDKICFFSSLQSLGRYLCIEVN